MSLSEPGDPSLRPSTQPSDSFIVTEGSKLDRAIKNACRSLERELVPEDDDNRFRVCLGTVWFKVRGPIQREGDSNLKSRLRTEEEFNAHVTPGSKEEGELIKLLRSMVNKEVPWEMLFQNEAFLKPGRKETTPAMARATILAWDNEFKGDLARVLCDTIADCLSKDRKPYARLTTVVNSSGTGKSRMVDQLGKEIITVPMCLRRTREGFPPPDEDLRNWLASQTGDRRTVQKMLRAFIYSLLMVTRKRLETISEELRIEKVPLDEAVAKKLSQAKRDKYVSSLADRQKKLAFAFRERMTKGQTHKMSNSYRRSFYLDVIEEAKEFVRNCGVSHSVCTSESKGPKEAGEMLCHFVDEAHLLDSKKGPQWPLIILAFDEADTLTDNPPNQENWNLFSELFRILRQIKDLQIFSLFLSTAGRFHKFSPDIHHELSARAREPSYRPLDPITEISFDDIMYPAPKDTVTIDDVVGINWISHLGRPLFGSYWDNLERVHKVESELLDYAKMKLLCGPHELDEQNPAGSLACLSMRFALEFNTDITAHRVAHAQVERHMRLCIAATPGLERMVTIPGSEPLLAEAAYELMGTNAVSHLAMHSDLNCIDRGRRGELVAALLIMQAFDVARECSTNGRWVSVSNFMEALLPPENYNILLQSSPTSLPMSHGDQATFEATFKDHGMWFNHIIKIERKEMISIDHLWKFLVRGAMILCATSQEGIDIILPVCNTKQNLGPDSVTAIIIQVNNANDYKATLQEHLFAAMDSVAKSTIFAKLSEPGVDCDPDSDSDLESESTTKTRAEPERKKRKVMPPEPVMVDSKAVIRIVMALASSEAAIVFKDRPKKKQHFDGLITFDIWLAGLSDKTFRQIKDEDLEHYKILLERSLAPHDGFELKDISQIGKKAKTSRAGRRRKMVPLAFPEHAHHRIHRVKDPETPAEGSGGQPEVAIQPATPDPQTRARVTRAQARATTGTAGPSTLQHPAD